MWTDVVKVETNGTVWIRVPGSDRPRILWPRYAGDFATLIVCSMVKVTFDRTANCWVPVTQD